MLPMTGSSLLALFFIFNAYLQRSPTCLWQLPLLLNQQLLLCILAAELSSNIAIYVTGHYTWTIAVIVSC